MFKSLTEHENQVIKDFIDDFEYDMQQPLKVVEIKDNGIIYYDYDTCKNEFLSLDVLLFNAQEHYN